MDMRQLKYFVQIVESGSLAKASRQLFIAQPALSQQMSRLEDEVGKALLVRSSRGVIPTDHGDALYHHARFILRQLDQAVAVARREHSSISGKVSVGMAPTTVCAIGLQLIKHMKAKYPGISVNVIEALSGHLEHMTRMGELDLAILFSTTAALDLSVEALLEEELFVILPRDSTLIAADRNDITLDELAALPLVLPSTGHGLRRRITLEFDRVNVTLDPVAEIDSLPLLMRCVADGMGVTIKPMSAIHSLQHAPETWRCLRVSDAEMLRCNYLYALAPEKLSMAAAIVRDELKYIAKTLVESGVWQGVRLITPSELGPGVPTAQMRDPAVAASLDDAVAEPVGEPVGEPIADPSAEPVAEPVAVPVAGPLSPPAANPVTQPVTNPVTQPPANAASQPPAASLVKPLAEALRQAQGKPAPIDKRAVNMPFDKVADSRRA